MNPALPRDALLSAGAVAAYVLILASQPTSTSFRDGWRCLVRYKRLFLLPFVFAFCHAAFGWWVRLDEVSNAGGALEVLTPWQGWQPPDWHQVLASARLPAVESVASIFDCAITTFPLSAVWGLLFVCNWRGYQGDLGRGLRQQFGPLVGVLAQAAMVVCALAACLKPILFGRISWLSTVVDERALLRSGEGINWLSFLFEYAIGVGVQIYLLLLASTWVRGLAFDLDALRAFTLRRWVFVSQWAGLLLLISSTGINLPLLLTNVAVFPGFGADRASWIVVLTRWLLASILIAFCSVQIVLVFHDGTLKRAFGDHLRLLRQFGWHIGWFVAVAGIHFFALAVANTFLPRALGEWTWPGACWKLFGYPLLWAGVCGWSLAGWVCLFYRLESGRPEAPDLVTY